MSTFLVRFDSTVVTYNRNKFLRLAEVGLNEPEVIENNEAVNLILLRELFQQKLSTYLVGSRLHSSVTF